MFFTNKNQPQIESYYMHAVTLLQKILPKSSLNIDVRITRTVFEACYALSICRELSISSIGRALKRHAKTKHNIKCIDRLFGNKTLHKKRKEIYARISHLFIGANKRPLIAVDWSGLTYCGRFHILRASLLLRGRSITLYEEVHEIQNYGNQTVHIAFLNSLKSVLPDHVCPIVITDAGFRNPWFKAVQKLKWDYLGRVRSETLYQDTISPDNTQWTSVKALYAQAKTKATYVGEVLLARSRSLQCHFYLAKKPKKNRQRKNLSGKKVQCSASLQHAKREKEPWLITTSLSPETHQAKFIMELYAKRMGIEESFRDHKSHRVGLGLRVCRSSTKERLAIALLIASITSLMLHLVGRAMRNKNRHKEFQVNSVYTQKILSDVHIGWTVFLREIILNEWILSIDDVLNAIKSTKSEAEMYVYS